MKQLNFRYFKTNRKQLFVRAIFFFRKKQKRLQQESIIKITFSKLKNSRFLLL